MHFHRVCSKQCRVILDLTKGIKFYLNRSMLPCFGFRNRKGEMLPFKAFQSMGNRGKRALHVRILLQIKCAEHLNLTHYFVPVNGARFSLKWRAHASTKGETLKMVRVFY